MLRGLKNYSCSAAATLPTGFVNVFRPSPATVRVERVIRVEAISLARTIALEDDLPLPPPSYSLRKSYGQLPDIDLLDINVWIALSYPEHVPYTRAERYWNYVAARQGAFCSPSLRFSNTFFNEFTQTMSLIN